MSQSPFNSFSSHEQEHIKMMDEGKGSMLVRPGVTPFSTITTSRNAKVADAGTVLRFNSSSAITLTLPPDTSGGFSGTDNNGMEAIVGFNYGTGIPTIVPDTNNGVTLSGIAPTIAQYSWFGVQRVAPNTWVWIKP